MEFEQFVKGTRKPEEARGGAEMHRALKYALANPNAENIREIARDIWVYRDVRDLKTGSEPKFKFFTSYGLAVLVDMLALRNDPDKKSPKMWMWWAAHEEAPPEMVFAYEDLLNVPVAAPEPEAPSAPSKGTSYAAPINWDEMDLPF